ncbi:MAG TPA: GNAT family N-acetyltransferase [Clostridiales bacterium]|nr:GNAT family N-acetyltransferase [Clostridiales bacterium]
MNKPLECAFDKKDGWFRLRACAIIIEQGCVLMAQNLTDSYYYSVGGAVNLHESTEEAVLREAFEETGIRYQIDRLCFIHENFFFGDCAQGENDARPYHEVALYYLMKPRGNLRLLAHDVTMFGTPEHTVWVPITELSHLHAYPRFFREHLGQIPDTVRRIISRETQAESAAAAQITDVNTAFLPTDDLTDGVIRLRCAWRKERDTARRRVPYYQFDILRSADGAVAGQCSLRLSLEEFMTWPGQIAYEVNPAFRGQQFAARACKLLYTLARRHQLPYVTITCRPENAASARTAELSGAVFVEESVIPDNHPMRADGYDIVKIYRKDL